MTSLEKINQIYVDAKNHESFKNKSLKCKNMSMNKFLKVQQYIVDKNYEDLYKVLGHALPEITNATYYHRYISRKEMDEQGTKPTVVHMRFAVLWQIWIEHLMYHFPLFKETQSDLMNKYIRWRNIGDHFYNTKPLDTIDIKDFAMFGVKDINTEVAKNDFDTFKSIEKLEDRMKWYFKRMFERAAMNKKQLLDLVEVKGGGNEKGLRVVVKVLQLMQFLTYESTHEEEVHETMSIIRNIEDINNDNFITTVQHINYAAIIMSSIHRKKLNDHAKNCFTARAQFFITYPECSQITQKRHNASRNDFILRKMYYDQIMKYLKKIGLNPKWNTKRLKKNNPILHHALTTFFDRKGGKTQKKEDYFSLISKSSAKHSIPQQRKSDNNFYYPTDVILSFISWYIVWYISKYNINYDNQAMAFYMKHNHYWEEMLEEKNLNVKSRDAFYAKDWDFYTIACNILTNDDDDCIKIDNFLGIKIVNDKLVMKINSNDNDENKEEEEDGSKTESDLSSMTGSMNDKNEDVTKKNLI